MRKEEATPRTTPASRRERRAQEAVRRREARRSRRRAAVAGVAVGAVGAVGSVIGIASPASALQAAQGGGNAACDTFFISCADDGGTFGGGGGGGAFGGGGGAFGGGLFGGGMDGGGSFGDGGFAGGGDFTSDGGSPLGGGLDYSDLGGVGAGYTGGHFDGGGFAGGDFVNGPSDPTFGGGLPDGSDYVPIHTDIDPRDIVTPPADDDSGDPLTPDEKLIKKLTPRIKALIKKIPAGTYSGMFASTVGGRVSQSIGGEKGPQLTIVLGAGEGASASYSRIPTSKDTGAGYYANLNLGNREAGASLTVEGDFDASVPDWSSSVNYGGLDALSASGGENGTTAAVFLPGVETPSSAESLGASGLAGVSFTVNDDAESIAAALVEASHSTDLTTTLAANTAILGLTATSPDGDALPDVVVTVDAPEIDAPEGTLLTPDIDAGTTHAVAPGHVDATEGVSGPRPDAPAPHGDADAHSPAETVGSGVEKAAPGTTGKHLDASASTSPRAPHRDPSWTRPEIGGHAELPATTGHPSSAGTAAPARPDAGSATTPTRGGAHSATGTPKSEDANHGNTNATDRKATSKSTNAEAEGPAAETQKPTAPKAETPEFTVPKTTRPKATAPAAETPKTAEAPRTVAATSEPRHLDTHAAGPVKSAARPEAVIPHPVTAPKAEAPKGTPEAEPKRTEPVKTQPVKRELPESATARHEGAAPSAAESEREHTFVSPRALANRPLPPVAHQRLR